jgi:hypothetical protein
MADQIFGQETNQNEGTEDHNYLVVNDDGSVNTRRLNNTDIPIVYFFNQILVPPTTVAVDVAEITKTTLIYDVDVTNGAGCNIGDYFGMFNSDSVANNRAYFGNIQAIAIGGGVGGTDRITLDTPIDFSFKAGNTAACFTRDLNVDGRKVADGGPGPQIFSIQVGPNATQGIEITRLMISMYTDGAVDLGSFGNLTSLTNGCVLRRVNGVVHNIYNVKNNGELANITFDYDPYTEIGQGQDGCKFRNTYNGEDKHDTAIVLEPGDELQWIVQDDLTGLDQFRVLAEGHYVNL